MDDCWIIFFMFENEYTEPETGEGFYNTNGEYAPNFVYGPNFELVKELKDTYEYPNNGWVWANCLSAAMLKFNL